MAIEPENGLIIARTTILHIGQSVQAVGTLCKAIGTLPGRCNWIDRTCHQKQKQYRSPERLTTEPSPEFCPILPHCDAHAFSRQRKPGPGTDREGQPGLDIGLPALSRRFGYSRKKTL